MRRTALDSAHAGSWLLVALAAALLFSSCSAQKGLSRDEIDHRSVEYFHRGVEQYQRGELRAARDSLRLARAYDIQRANPAIPEMIEKVEERLQSVGRGTGAAGTQPPATPPRRDLAPPVAPTVVTAQSPGVAGEPALKTYRSRRYPYAVDVPEGWSPDTSVPRVRGLEVEVLTSPKTASIVPDLSTLGLPLADDVDTRAFVEAMRKALRAVGIEPVEIGKRSVDGAEATILRARVTDQQGKHVSTMAMFEVERVGWMLIFDAPAEDSERLQPLFHRMLDSFRVDSTRRIV